MPTPADAEADYAALCDEVEALDPAAAAYMRGTARQLPGFALYRDLDGCFTFNDTPQGVNYWYVLHLKVIYLRKDERPRYFADGLPIPRDYVNGPLIN